jgi:lauroyl/myristoyl acyltransferase
MISITAGAWEGARVATVNIHGCQLDLATGAPGLALLSRAALLPVFTIRDGDQPRISVVVGESIQVATGADRDERLFNAAQTFADRMAIYVSSHPLQWRDWEKIRKAGV